MDILESALTVTNYCGLRRLYLNPIDLRAMIYYTKVVRPARWLR